ncbi:MAG: ParB/RepB/Spo0J family partition protein [Endomicrobiia bacterium]
MSNKHLGRGLGALISSLSQNQIAQQSNLENVSRQQNNVVSVVNISSLIPPKWQPRKKFDIEKLNQLAETIKSSGIIEPLIVTPVENNQYEIVCGERRYRAAQIAQLNEIPVIIKDLDQKQKSFLALIENIQREDLNPIEESTAYKNILEEYNITQEELAKIIGKDRTVITNSLRILTLPKEVLEYIEDGLISAGHARSLASISNIDTVKDIAQKIVQDKLTVRDVENIVKFYKSKKVKSEKLNSVPAEIKHLENDLQQTLGTKVKIVNTKHNKGKIVIHYHSLDEFDKIVKKLKK